MAKKSLGQNFLLDLNLTGRIARAALGGDRPEVLEIGPGPGGLTRALIAEGAPHIVAIERDRRCIDALEEIAAAYPGRLEIVEGDALKTDHRQLVTPPVRIAANLPYNIATPLFVGWLSADTWSPWWESAVLMFQKEVAERLVAAPGNRSYGRLSVIAQWRARVCELFTVNARAFTPPPKITSAVVKIVPLPQPANVPQLSTLGRVTAAAFGQRRKMLRSSLKGLSGDSIELARAAGIDPSLRAEQIAVADYVNLARIVETQRI